MRYLMFCLAICLSLGLAACGGGDRKPPPPVIVNGQPAWVGSQEAMLADIREVCMAYGIVSPVTQPARGFITQSHITPFEPKTYSIVTTLRPTRAEDKNGKPVNAYIPTARCDSCNDEASGVEKELLQKIIAKLNATYRQIMVRR